MVPFLIFAAARGALITMPRRAFLRTGVAAGAGALGAASLGVRPASAGVTDSVRQAEAALSAAARPEEVDAALGRLLELARDYDGMPSSALRDELMGALRARRAQLQGAGWDGSLEEQYTLLQRVVDPWRVTELQAPAQGALFVFPFAYIGLLGAQQARRARARPRLRPSPPARPPACKPALHKPHVNPAHPPPLQFVPQFFNAAYAAAALVVFGPLLVKIFLY